ncbi:MAG: glucosaminidase domain-containing protein [Hyphomicrobiaceae bacterium]|nr:glucosaminidase domain-containing protein [Hyphomicrobiaceae bacterium]
MKRHKSLGLAAFIILQSSAGIAADLPAIRTSQSNKVPDCATPGRLTAFLRARNDKLDPRFEKIAVEYMRRGEELGLRWDYTFYQMVLETGYLTFRGDGGRRGDVKPAQNNFAGLGATGNGNPGESFPDVSTGVLAHLQHVLVYSGEHVEKPVAERTRKVQEWGIVKSLQKRSGGTVTFNHLATKWAPGSSYVASLQTLARKFQDEFCQGADPHPEWVAEARGVAGAATQVAAAAEPALSGRGAGASLARKAIEDGKADGDDRRSGLGGAGIAKAASQPTPSYSILNAEPSAPPAGTASSLAPVEPEAKPRIEAEKIEKPAFVMASAAGAMAKSAAPKAPAAKSVPPAPGATATKCRVWTASYGGLKALIIRVRSPNGTDYTVLDVNEGAEKREAEAYIAAYAKGGEVAGEFASQSHALDKAFELCPES